MSLLTLLYFTSGSLFSFPSVIISDVEENNSTIYGDYISFTDTQQDFVGNSCQVDDEYPIKVELVKCWERQALPCLIGEEIHYIGHEATTGE